MQTVYAKYYYIQRIYRVRLCTSSDKAVSSCRRQGRATSLCTVTHFAPQGPLCLQGQLICKTISARVRSRCSPRAELLPKDGLNTDSLRLLTGGMFLSLNTAQAPLLMRNVEQVLKDVKGTHVVVTTMFPRFNSARLYSSSYCLVIFVDISLK